MKLISVFLLSIALLSYSAFSQTQAVSKIYLFNPNRSLQPAISLPSAFRIEPTSRVDYTILETDTDSLAFISPGNQLVYLLVEPGKSYYYGLSDNNFLYQEVSANAFWLSVAAVSKSVRRYSITKKSGVVEIK